MAPVSSWLFETRQSSTATCHLLLSQTALVTSRVVKDNAVLMTVLHVQIQWICDEQDSPGDDL